jgi:branched-chain amino acid transport system substrate-binding protein
MNKKVISLVGVCLLVLGASWSKAEGKGVDAKAIKIGVAGPMKFVAGENHWRGATMARDEINKAGGVSLGGVKVPIELVKVDTNEILSVSDAVLAVERSITRDKIDFFVGTKRSESALAMQDVAMKHKKIFIGCGAAHPELCVRVAKDYNKFKYYFRVVINSKYMGKILFVHLADVAKIVREQLGIQKPKVAVLADKLKWADPVVKAVEGNAPKMGLEVVGVWRPSATASDVTAELAAIKDSGAHIIFQAVSGPMGVALGKQWGELEIPAALIGGNAYAIVKTFWEATGGYGHYVTTQTGIGPAKITEKTMPFWDEYIKRFNAFPGYESVTYDALYVLKEAIERAGALDPDAVVSALEQTDYSGAFGRIVFYPKDNMFAHDLKFGPGYNTWVLVQWRDGGNLSCVWPYGWEGITYEGTEKYQLPPWVVKYWKKK